MFLDRFFMQPAEIRQFTIDYTDRLQDPNILQSINSTVVTPVTTTPFVINSAGIGTTLRTVIIYCGGGEDGERYKVEVTVQTTDGQIWQDELEFVVEEI